MDKNKIKFKFFIVFCIFFGIFSNLIANEQSSDDDFDELENEYQTQNIEVYDPLSGYNRAMTKFNLFLYDYIEHPIIIRYNGLAPKPVKKGISNFFYNLCMPVRFIGYLIALKPKKALAEVGYFTFNTTFGLGGFMNVVGKQKDMDIGTGLGHLGVGGGMHIVLPILGPSNLRDTLTMPLNALANPITYIKPASASVSVGAFKQVNEVSIDVKEIDMLYKTSLDPYPIMRDLYEKKRKELSK